MSFLFGGQQPNTQSPKITGIQVQTSTNTLPIRIFYGTVKITQWATMYAQIFETKPGIEVAAVIAAVMAPYMALQAAAIKFYFEARPRV